VTATSLSSSRPSPDLGQAPASDGALLRLDRALKGCAFIVREVRPDPEVPERSRHLQEIGFYPGEHGRVMTRGFPGGDPLVVRIGQSTFALRAAEAACVHVEVTLQGAE
jgi:ferrous iron transport protein A